MSNTTQSVITEYHEIEERAKELLVLYKKAKYEVATPSGMKDAIKARADLRNCRLDMEILRKEVKAPILVKGTVIDDEAKRIIAPVSATEVEIDTLIKEEEKRKEQEKAEKERIEKARVTAIQARIDAIRNLPLTIMGKKSTEILDTANRVEQMDMTNGYDEFVNEAVLVHNHVLKKIHEMHGLKVTEEAQQEQLRVERAALEQIRIEQAQSAILAAEAEERAKKALEALEAKIASQAAAEAAKAVVVTAAGDSQQSGSVLVSGLDQAKETVLKQVVMPKYSASLATPSTEIMSACQDLNEFVVKYGHLSELTDVIEAANEFLIQNHYAQGAGMITHAMEGTA